MRKLLLIVPLIVILLTCTKRNNNELKLAPHKLLTGLCIKDHTPIYKKPGSTYDIYTTLYLGDELWFLGDSANNNLTTLYHIEIAEGSDAWIDKNYVVMNSRSAAIIKETAVFSTPNASANIVGNLKPTEFVAATHGNNNWVEVVGYNRKTSGWIPNNCISYERNDVLIASLACQELLDKNGEIKMSELPYFLKTIPENGSILEKYLMKLFEEQVTKNIEESISEYENNYYTQLTVPKD